nr:hypothetical protein [Neobacillus sp. Marseille-Q6967]
MRKIVLIILITFFTLGSKGLESKAVEPSELEWEKEIADGLYLQQQIDSKAQSMDTTEDNGIIAISTKRNKYNLDIYVVKTDQNGEKIWEKNVGSSEDEYGVSIISTKENNYIITGLKQTRNAGLVSYVACLNHNGEIVWENQIGSYRSDKITSVSETSDGGFILTGSSKDYPRNGLKYNGISLSNIPYYGVSLLKLDNKGQLQWKKVYETKLRHFGAGYSFVESIGKSVIETSDGYIIAGSGLAPNSFSNWEDILISKTDKSGNLQWQKTYNSYGTDFFDAAYSIQKTSDNGFIIVGNTGEPSRLALIKLNSIGNLQWMKTYGGNKYEYGYSVIETPDKGFVVTGTTNSFGNGGNDIYLVKTDMNGNTEWERTLGSTGNEVGLTVKKIKGGFLIGGIIDNSKYKLWKFSNDVNPPITTLTTKQKSNENGWFNTNVEIDFTSIDTESEIEKTLYRINDSNWNNFQSPFVLDQEGILKIDYFSTDTNGNQENQNSKEIKIDKTAPETIVSPVKDGWYPSDVSITLNGSDSLSGVDKTQYQVNDGEWLTYENEIIISNEGVHIVKFRSIDYAGNVEGTKSIEVKIDKTAPTLDVTFNYSVITDRNHKFVPIKAMVAANDNLSGIASFELVSIISNQPDNGNGDGNTSQDIQGAEFDTSDTDFLVRAERSSKGDRIYTVTYKATDNAGNYVIIPQYIVVNHDNSKNK